MFPKSNIKTYTIGSSNLKFHFLESGNLKEITDNDTRINTYVGNNLEPTISNIFIRVEKEDDVYFGPLMGVASNSKFSVNDDCAIYDGCFLTIKYKVLVRVIDNTFIFRVKFEKNKDYKNIKLFYGMDISIGNKGGIDSNEAYQSQYIDHKVYKDNYGYVICSRQNSGRHNYVEQGCLFKTVGYSTDGFQFYGEESKFTTVPQVLSGGSLPNEIYQYEFAYAGLETKSFNLNKSISIDFYGIYTDNHDDQITKPLYLDKALEASNSFKEVDSIEQSFVEHAVSFYNCLEYNPLTKEELDKFYPKRNLEEIMDEDLISFFLDNKAHVVLPEKELMMERPSGDLLLSLNRKGDTYDFEKALASTTYIYGVFNSQIVYGNTSFNKLMSNQRNPLNLQRITGQRIFVKIDGEYKLLTLPSVYEMGINYARWIYKLDDDYLEIKTIMSLDSSVVTLYFKSLSNKNYEVLVSHHITMNQTENTAPVLVKRLNDKKLRFDFSIGSMCKNKYPEYAFELFSDNEFEYHEDEVFYTDGISRNDNLVVLGFNDSEFNISICGVDDNCLEEVSKVPFNEDVRYLEYYNELLNNFDLSLEGDAKDKIESYNYLSYWFLHDALMHYISPHGLEQYNGAAWGTRDVCQGPFELFLSLGNYKEIKHIIKTVFSHQFIQTSQFPQWFMFDRYYNICDNSSHGDVIVWPLRMVGMYLEKTKDYSILEEVVPYMDRNIMQPTGSDTIYTHLKKAIESIENNFIEGTSLSCYGGGDWDDTLQPANRALKQEMVSGWTPELTYEAINYLVETLSCYDFEYSNHLKNVSDNIYNDYHKYMIKDGVPTGFAHFKDGKIKYILHPLDEETSLKYRLLPLTRGVISGMLTKEEQRTAYKIINKYLYFPDGVRLMDKSIKYNGGINTYFQRAETASNFGREIGLQYCHAHIRYCESLQKSGQRDKLFNELLKINPVIMNEVVDNALPRQRNSYFSSSDGDYLNRYDVMKNYGLLKKGKIGVKAGWRVYSSGSGIYLFNVITGLLGVEIFDNKLTLRPNLDKSLDGLSFKFKVLGKNVTFNYHLTGKKQIVINGKSEKCKKLNTGALLINKDINDNDVIDVYC